ncbi:aspartate aminotransferase family protein [Halomontanus rarus]|uniref:aspartate aminotransferase family protein n=1 Tax=Halomontanus rarus TaxID=3034020 RepID=UPI0023E8106D|nr:aminotransferase class III-fold pyridoxal phosphate-dependent enzyme [Halovivax sp. TS33]
MARESSRSRDRSIDRSTELLERARELIPRAAQTNSKSPAQFVQGVSPTHVERAEGCRVWDVDGNEYIDTVMGLGPNMLGHNYPAVTEAVEDQLGDGTAYSMPHSLQVDVAELIVDTVPCAEMVRFGKNGNDMTALSAKLARAHTGKDVIATQGYHGWPDVFMSAGPLNRGIPDAVGDYTESFDYNDIESLERIFEDHPDDVAAIVTTPVNLSAPEDDFLERVREIADREETLLVFDEILTGYRYALGGAQEYFDVTPDLACFAKGISNGYPLSALAGREDVMRTIEDDDFIFSMTYAGEAASLAAAKACITEQIERGDVHDHIWRQGRAIRDGYNELAEEHGVDHLTECVGMGPRPNTTFEDGDGADANLLESLFMQEAHKGGVLFAGSHLPSYSHADEDIEEMLAVYDDAMGVLAEAVESGTVESSLEGKPVGASLREQLGEED